MSPPLIPNEQECSQMPPCISKPAITTQALHQIGYQQALKDFAFNDLLHQLKTYSDASFDAAWVALTTQEAETLAGILIQTLSANLNGNLLAAYLDATRCKTLGTVNPLTSLQLPPPATELPPTFPDVELPRYLYGDRLRWISNGEITDWGTAIGRFYSFAPHRCCWQWCYLIWLDADSPSAAWVKADIAWEDDIEPLETEETL
ncbi:hypothetical protein K9N68_12105 [Kovacikia minuta CCNUW1]|uniref:hypothetical protein n=1 Tax=Kovacikia minuta TaxID=2931930 RepID=UPI001CCDAC12|nr:hypothetical protein [Kovacikia minuta]UBF28548.1 hypothetical protein K9N68_12105 [Kovacikia minuta CCNUW1]